MTKTVPSISIIQPVILLGYKMATNNTNVKKIGKEDKNAGNIPKKTAYNR